MATRTAARSASHLIPKASTLPEGSLVGVVVSAGKMQKTVKVRHTTQKFETFLKRWTRSHMTRMVYDPADSLRQGDVVRIAPWKKTKKVQHVVTDLMVPFGTPASERPAVQSFEELLQDARARWTATAEKRRARKQEDKASRESQEGLKMAEREGAGDLTGNRIDKMREEAVEHQTRAEELAEESADKDINLEKRMEGVRL